MNKIYKKNLIRLVSIVMLMTLFLFGCGNSNTKKEEVTTEVETTEKQQSKEEVADTTQKQEKDEKTEEISETNSQEEKQEEETETNMAEAQITTTVEEFYGLAVYIKELEDNAPHIVIYNEKEGYIIDMKEGEHYQLKKDDRIFLNVTSNMKNVAYSIPEKEYKPIDGGWEIIPDYSQFDSPHECRYKIVLENDPTGEKIKFTCYLDAPTD